MEFLSKTLYIFSPACGGKLFRSVDVSNSANYTQSVTTTKSSRQTAGSCFLGKRVCNYKVGQQCCTSSTILSLCWKRLQKYCQTKSGFLKMLAATFEVLAQSVSHQQHESLGSLSLAVFRKCMFHLVRSAHALLPCWMLGAPAFTAGEHHLTGLPLPLPPSLSPMCYPLDRKSFFFMYITTAWCCK